MQTLSEKILDGLQHCLPETDEEGMSDCISCPYNNCCDDETEVNLPVQMVEDIRELLKAQMDPIKPVNGMHDMENVARDLRYLKSYGRVWNIPQITEIAESALALLKEQGNEKKRIMKVIWDTLHEGLSIDTIPDQDWVYERIRHRIEDT